MYRLLWGLGFALSLRGTDWDPIVVTVCLLHSIEPYRVEFRQQIRTLRFFSPIPSPSLSASPFNLEYVYLKCFKKLQSSAMGVGLLERAGSFPARSFYFVSVASHVAFIYIVFSFKMLLCFMYAISSRTFHLI